MDIKLPSLGENVDSGVVVNVLVVEGQKIAKGDPLIEIESEKAIATVPSPAEGVVGKIHVRAGDKIGVGQRILTLAGSAAEAAAVKSTQSAPGPAGSATAVETGPPAEQEEKGPGAVGEP
ncbi:MAG: biotin/lipoyl-binding protein, partial [Verrucomicrobiae bacterium]|nr:biotin/lipoyl-binding protein [Verrucomicrobiae bacterium]